MEESLLSLANQEPQGLFGFNTGRMKSGAPDIEHYGKVGGSLDRGEGKRIIQMPLAEKAYSINLHLGGKR